MTATYSGRYNLWRANKNNCTQAGNVIDAFIMNSASIDIHIDRHGKWKGHKSKWMFCIFQFWSGRFFFWKTIAFSVNLWNGSKCLMFFKFIFRYTFYDGCKLSLLRPPIYYLLREVQIPVWSFFPGLYSPILTYLRTRLLKFNTPPTAPTGGTGHLSPVFSDHQTTTS